MELRCGGCGGEGSVSYVEDGREVEDVCYHCSGTGRIDEETAHHDRIAAAATVLAERRVAAFKKACDVDPDGEGFAFRAAENMMSEHDYRYGLVLDYADEFGRKLAEMDEVLLDALLDALVPEREPEAVVATVPAPSAAPVAAIGSDDEIPF